MLLHVHLREKVLLIQVAEGKQCVFWLYVLAVQRYVVEPDSYSSPFSEELTPKCVRTPAGESSTATRASATSSPTAST